MAYAIVIVLVLILDQAVKYWTNLNIALGDIQSFIPGFIQLTNVRNTGAAFGIGGGSPAAVWIFVALTVVACAVIIFFLARGIVKGAFGRIMLALVMAGGIGNCIDRLIYGYVVDMFKFEFWESFPVFNVADIFITLSGIAFCFWLIFHKEKTPPEGAPTGKDSPPPPRRARARGASRDSRPAGPQPPRREPQVRTDYITQLKRPVSQAKAALENERRAAEEFSQWNPPAEAAPQGDPFAEFYEKPAPKEPPARQRPQPGMTPAAPDPLAEFYETPAGKPAQAPTAPAPEAKAAAAQPKKNGSDFTLEDILAEFSDK